MTAVLVQSRRTPTPGDQGDKHSKCRPHEAMSHTPSPTSAQMSPAKPMAASRNGSVHTRQNVTIV